MSNNFTECKGCEFRKVCIQIRDCCDNCKHYSWYIDTCDKWDSIVDARNICDSYEPNRKDRITCKAYESRYQN